MKTWEEYINEDIYGERYTPVDVKCPKCKHRLYRIDVILTGYPPQYKYECIECGWVGYARK